MECNFKSIIRKDETKIMEIRLINYNTQIWPFRVAVQILLADDNLEKLHENVLYDKFDREHDQSTIWHKKFYQNNDAFLTLYRNFVHQVIKPNFPNEEFLVYQKIPTFRVHLKNNLSVGEFHRDRDYNHGRNEINFHLPFTNTNKSNSIWMETKEGLEDYRPYVLNYGQVLMFDGANLKHGNTLNDSEETRVSVDFRVIPFSQYEDSEKGSINTQLQFKIGGYFEKI